MKCVKCGKAFEGEGMMFCPYCGAKQQEERESPEAEKWVARALAIKNLKEREKILLEARNACPDSFAIEWELLFIGHPRKAQRGKLDFSIIKSFLLETYRKPEEFQDTARAEMRREIFHDPQLTKCLQLSGTPEATLEAYAQRLCLDYVEIFLEGDSRISSTLFGFRLERNRTRMLASPVARVIEAIRGDETLTQEEQALLTHGLYRAFEQRTGETAGLDEQLASPV